MPSVSEPVSQAQPATPVAATQRYVLAAALLAALGLASGVGDGRMALLLAIGLALGATLYHAAFGFSGAYWSLFVRRDTRGVQAQLLMVGAATLLFAPLLAQGELFGRDLVGALAPVGWQVAIGAFAFGIGMQLGGGCGSGTLYTVGGGGARQLLTLAAFVIGSFWASLHMAWWQQLPSWGVVALGPAWGWPQAVAAQLGALALAAWVLRQWGRGGPAADPEGARDGHWLRGPWPLLGGALTLAGLNALTLVVAGHPWSITWAFSLWGAKAASAAGWDPSGNAFWNAGFPAYALSRSVLEDVTSVMNLGIVIGALAAAALAGRFGRGQTLTPKRVWLAALLGGLLMGYGARIAFGCNIGAFFSGVASTSLHGWLWIVAALAGNWVGVKLRPGLGLAG